MHLIERLKLRIGALPALWVVWGLALAFALWAVADLYVYQISGGLAQNTYDAMVRARLVVAAPDPRVVIVDIDEASLSRMSAEFGRWPWPRDTLATVLDFIEREGPAVIAWDVVFSDADRLSPGGDKALDEAAKRSAHSVFSVIRLPAENDGLSKVSRATLPGLWLGAAAVTDKSATLAVVPPVLPAVAAAPLGYNNGYPESDGVLRRYRYAEALSDGSVVQSLALASANRVAPDLIAQNRLSTLALRGFESKSTLIAWRKSANLYPRVPFADVFAKADGGKPKAAVPSFAGKVVLIGATASSLHDIHPTPLAPLHAGVDSMATAIDNALHQRHVAELPRSLQAGMAVALCAGIALWVRRRGIAALDAALLLLPGTLLAIGYVSLNGAPVFIDLNLAAGIALLFLTVLRVWNGWRRSHWCSLPEAAGAALHLMPLYQTLPVADAALDRVIAQLERWAPQCRLVCADATATWPSALRWPELARVCAVVGPQAALAALRQHPARGQMFGPDQPVARTERSQVALAALDAWHASAPSHAPENIAKVPRPITIQPQGETP